jgi:hypothetical protein
MFEYYLLFMASHIFTESNESCDENKLALAGLCLFLGFLKLRI